jgi:prevent-host-death family protein
MTLPAVTPIEPCITGDTLVCMTEVAIRDLRNRGGDILDRVARGEAMTVTRDGHPIAELRPLPRRPLPATTLLERWRALPAVDLARLRADIDDLLDPSL